jgi:hypothetical protein
MSTKKTNASSTGKNKSTQKQKKEKFQFLHETGYAITKGQQRSKKTVVNGIETSVKYGFKKACISDVIGEAAREACNDKQYFRHVRDPKPPMPLYGVQPENLRDWCKELEKKASFIKVDVKKKDGTTYKRKQRTSAVIMIGMVASYPGLHDMQDPMYVKWLKFVTAWAMQRFKKNLVSVLAHTDEPHGHIHILVQNGDQPGGSVRHLMAGWSQVGESKKNGVKGKDITAVFKRGCQEMQDHFHARVGSKCGLQRISPNPRPRIGYAKAKARAKLEAEILKETLDAEIALDQSIKKKRLDAEEKIMFERAQAAAQISRDTNNLDRERSEFEFQVKRQSEGLTASQKALETKLASSDVSSLMALLREKDQENSQLAETIRDLRGRIEKSSATGRAGI